MERGSHGLHDTAGEVSPLMIYRYLRYLAVINVTTILLGILFYGEKFDFWSFAISYLGGTVTPSGKPNLVSFLIFTGGMIICSLTCFRISLLWKGAISLPNRSLNRVIFEVCGIGYILMLMPHNIFDPLHMIGAGLVFSSFWLFCIITLHRMRDSIGTWRFFLYHLILQGTVLPYAFLFFIGSGIKQNMQKFAVTGLVIVMVAISRMYLLHHCEPARMTFPAGPGR